jgi:hypothetical protein
MMEGEIEEALLCNVMRLTRVQQAFKSAALMRAHGS